MAYDWNDQSIDGQRLMVTSGERTMVLHGRALPTEASLSMQYNG